MGEGWDGGIGVSIVRPQLTDTTFAQAVRGGDSGMIRKTISPKRQPDS